MSDETATVTSGVSDKDKQDAITKLQRDPKLVKLASSTAADFVTTVKGSVLFQYNWDEILSTAPMTLSTLGSCFVAATTTEAQGTKVEAIGAKFQYIESVVLPLSAQSEY